MGDEMRETYSGRKIVTRTKRTAVGRELVATVNGGFAASTYWSADAEPKMMDRIRNEIDFIDARPVGGWDIHWYDSKSVELCPEGIHAQPIGGPCPHSTCQEADATPKTPCPACGTPAGRHIPIGVKGPWVNAHRPEGSRDVCEASNLPDHANRLAA